MEEGALNKHLVHQNNNMPTYFDIDPGGCARIGLGTEEHLVWLHSLLMNATFDTGTPSSMLVGGSAVSDALRFLDNATSKSDSAFPVDELLK